MQLDLINLKESNDFLNKVFDHITSAIFIVDKDVKVQAFNVSSKNVFMAEEMMGKHFGNAINCFFPLSEGTICGEASHCSSCVIRKSMLETFLKKVPAYKEKLTRQFLVNDQVIVKNLLYTTEYINFHGEEMVLVLIDDVTELENQRKQLEEQNRILLQINEDKNKFLGIAAHDVRNPIAAIMNCAVIIKNMIQKNQLEEVDRFLDIVESKSRFSLELINDLLDISKIESGRLDLKITSENMVGILTESTQFNQMLASQKDIKISLAVQENLPPVAADRNRIEQVLNNLIGNAMKFSPRGSEIEIKSYQQNEHVVTTIYDQGPGIPEKDLQYIFNAFHRGGSKETGGEKSTGLGLAIVKKVVESHKGKVWVDSEVNKGSAFSFSLPKNI
jgi:signal transduction histidine kinase